MQGEPEFCVECGQTAVTEVVATVKHKVGSREVVIEQERHLRCGHCGTISYRGAMLEESQHAIAAALRRQDNLLTPDELRAIRLKYGFTQAEMETLLSIGPKTWVRWERGKVVQSSAADQMIRQIDRSPDVVRDLMTRRGTHNPRTEEVLAAFDRRIEQRIADALDQRFPEVAADTLRSVARVAAVAARTSQRSFGQEEVRAGS